MIADDILVYGKTQTIEEAKFADENNLRGLLGRCKSIKSNLIKKKQNFGKMKTYFFE